MSETKKFKVVMGSNYDDETISESLVCDNINEYYGKIVVDRLNSINPEGKYWFQLVSQDYKLYVWEP